MTDEPIVHNPELRALVELARAQPRPEIGVGIDDIRRGVEHARAQRRFMFGAGLALAAGLLLSVVAVPKLLRSTGAEPASQAPNAAAVDGAPERAEVHEAKATRERGAVADEPDQEDRAADSAPEQARERTTEHDLGSAATRGDSASAAELSKRAEAQMAAGKRAAAIRTLTKLVQVHPHSAEARAALMDLGRLHRASGSSDRARCAYTTYLERWPMSSLQADVRRALDALGPGPSCRGLNPQHD